MRICLDAGHYGKYNQSPVDGRMATEPVMLTPDQNGALRWPGLAE